MPNLNKLKKKERFLSKIEGVDESAVMEFLKANEGLDLYTYVVSNGAFASGEIDLKELQEFLQKIYADWYFLAKNKKGHDIDKDTLLFNSKYSPANMTKKEIFQMLKSNEYDRFIPIYFQNIDDSNEGYYVCISADKLYDYDEDLEMMARLYINFPAEKVIDFTKEVLDRCYMQDLPLFIKFFSNDYRNDNVIIYADFEHVEQIVKMIEEIKSDYPMMFEKVGDVSPLLGRVNDYIGFGEHTRGTTYLKSRVDALENINNIACNEVVRENIVADEKKIIFRKDGKNFTSSEYLLFLIERNCMEIIDRKINALENSKEKMNVHKLKKLYILRENINKYLDLQNEVNKLKKSITRNNDYRLDLSKVEKVNMDDNYQVFDENDKDTFNYINKLYNLFSTADEKMISDNSKDTKKHLIATKVFEPTKSFLGNDTKEFLTKFFKEELLVIFKQILDDKLTEVKYQKRNSLLSNLKLKECAMLKQLIKAILNDGDDGRELIDRCIDDFIRILSIGSNEIVQIYYKGKWLDLNSDLCRVIVDKFPELQKRVNELTKNREFIGNILEKNNINKENICINNTTKNYCKKRENKKVQQRQSYAYYEPSLEYVKEKKMVM